MSEQHTAAPVPGHSETTATVEHDGGEAHLGPNFLGLEAPWFISLAMLFVFAILIWKKVPGAIGRALDSKIDRIRENLSEAEGLRKEAEALKAEYQAKAKAAEADAAEMVERAKAEASNIVAKAKKDAEALIERRGKMAEDKIAAEEQAAIKQLRSAAADAASRAAARLIADRHDSGSDAKLVDQSIAELAKR